MVSQAPHKFGAKLGKKRGNVGRRYFKVGGGQRRLHPAKVHISKDLWNICDQRLSAKSGLLCKSREYPAPKIYQQMATQPSNIGKCIGVQLRRVGHGLRQPTMENNFTVAGEIENEPSCEVPDCSTLLGWNCLVAPVSSFARPKVSCSESQSSLGPVLQLSRGGPPPR